ncbi:MULTISPECIES: helix-turn-helix domain-containing protein [unclassified Haladaptatus]|uniref:helix-turn-helix domain-containing protein n=1 Tax=unclassified Haladaptatus TaxID=2622732 RepID=UPI0023E7B436|nr:MULTISPECIES: helix-turn-helix domain-containing protein [unclassified Haladaptatus]
MRYFDFTLTPEDGAIHPVDKAIADFPGVTRESLMHVNSLGDGTGVLLYRLSGDPEPLIDELCAEDAVLNYDLLDVNDDVFHIYFHVVPGEPAGTLMKLAQKYALIIDTPLKFTGTGGIRTTVVGTHDMLRQALEEIPNSIRISVEQVGRYSPDGRNLLSSLTDRQLEVFQTAVEQGYYEIPRRATHKDIAAELGCAPSTVDEHLRKAESRVLTSLVR